MMEFINSKAAFEQKTLPHVDALYRTAAWMVKDKEEAERLVRQTYAKAYHSRYKFRTVANCQSHLFRLMVSTFTKEFQGSHKLLASNNSNDVNDDGIWKPSANQEINSIQVKDLLSKISNAEVRDIIMSLSNEFKLAIVLSWLEGFSYREIAFIAGIRLETVKSRLYQGCQLIQNGICKFAMAESHLFKAR